MRVTCTNCGGAHTPWDCKRPAKKSTAPSESRARRSRSANESLPVDTNSPEVASEQPQAHGSSPCMDQGKISGQQPTVQLVTAGETAPCIAKARKREQEPRINAETKGDDPPAHTSEPKRHRGRPKSITDMAAYKRAKQREYRAKWKGRG